MNTKDLIKAIGLDWAKVWVTPDMGSNLEHDFDINPEDFLNFAELDIEGNDDRALVNALSNAKRAIDSQVDKALHCLGVNPKGKKFPAKIEILKELGMVAPRILRKVTTKRNYLEHEYKRPEKDEVEDAIDVASLFVEACNRTLQTFQFSFALGEPESTLDGGHRYRNCVTFYYKEDEKQFELRGIKEGNSVGEVVVTPDKQEYRAILRLAIAIEKGKGVEEALKHFHDSIGNP